MIQFSLYEKLAMFELNSRQRFKTASPNCSIQKEMDNFVAEYKKLEQEKTSTKKLLLYLENSYDEITKLGKKAKNLTQTQKEEVFSFKKDLLMKADAALKMMQSEVNEYDLPPITCDDLIVEEDTDEVIVIEELDADLYRESTGNMAFFTQQKMKWQDITSNLDEEIVPEAGQTAAKCTLTYLG